MTIKSLVYDADAPNHECSIAATIKSGDTVNMPHDHKFLYVGAPTAAACTVTPRIAIGGTYCPIGFDLYGNSYPRAGFTGGTMLFAVIPGSGVTIAATSTFLYVKSAK
jgi:hypothetical protein